MSVLTRFNIGLVRYKARIFEQGSRKITCRVCTERRYGILVRFIEPKKHEDGICHECIARMADGIPIKDKVDLPAEVKTKPRIIKKRKKKTLIKKLRGQDNDNSVAENTDSPENASNGSAGEGQPDKTAE
jgi:hypothetical protein